MWRSIWCLLLISMMQQGHADNFPFTNNIETTESNTNISFLINCNRPDAASRCASGGSTAAYTDPTAFLQEIVFVDNIRYYHLIVGDPAQGFSQEVYVDARNCCYQQYESRPKSASEGNGSGHPARVVFQMIMSDDDFEQQVLKDSLATKPLIMQTSDDGQSSASIRIDMTGIDYATTDVSGTISNNFELFGFNDGNFDSSLTHDEHISAGRYVYVPGAGTGASAGTYLYSEDAYLQHLADENLFKNPAQNP